MRSVKRGVTRMSRRSVGRGSPTRVPPRPRAQGWGPMAVTPQPRPRARGSRGWGSGQVTQRGIGSARTPPPRGGVLRGIGRFLLSKPMVAYDAAGTMDWLLNESGATPDWMIPSTITYPTLTDAEYEAAVVLADVTGASDEELNGWHYEGLLQDPEWVAGMIGDPSRFPASLHAALHQRNPTSYMRAPTPLKPRPFQPPYEDMVKTVAAHASPDTIGYLFGNRVPPVGKEWRNWHNRVNKPIEPYRLPDPTPQALSDEEARLLREEEARAEAWVEQNPYSRTVPDAVVPNSRTVPDAVVPNSRTVPDAVVPNSRTVPSHPNGVQPQERIPEETEPPMSAYLWTNPTTLPNPPHFMGLGERLGLPAYLTSTPVTPANIVSRIAQRPPSPLRATREATTEAHVSARPHPTPNMPTQRYSRREQPLPANSTVHSKPPWTFPSPLLSKRYY